ncbi:MAG TPA: LapA family protein [Actinocrinis sp.]|jgi:uncharacterized integral membrane protein
MSQSTPPPGPYAAQEPATSGKQSMADRLATPKALIGALITIAAVWFIIANNTRVRIRLWIPYVTARLWIVLLVTFVAGALVGMLFARRRARR